MMRPKAIFSRMMDEDSYSRWLGVELLSIIEGKCCLKMTVKSEMLNGFKITHGGITYALSDSTLAFAANSYGFKAVSVDTSIAHLAPVFLGDVLRSESNEISRGRSIAHYLVEVFNQEDKLVSYFKGTVKFSKETWS
jgi:acyl-CoA thioesterase